MAIWKEAVRAAVIAATIVAASMPLAAQVGTPASETAQLNQEQGVPDGGPPQFIREETPQQRKDRIGTQEDPGPNPDPKKIFHRFGHEYRIERFERRLAAYDQPEGWVRPLAMVNFPAEIYQQNEKYVWVWIVTPESLMRQAEADAAAAQAAESGYNQASIDFLKKSRSEFTQLDVPAAPVTVRFEESSAGLPTDGSWRNALAAADMNGDGNLDLVAPPQRGIPNNTPAIFLGDGRGNWRYWEETKWPRALDYGSVAAADFNRDGHQDLAFGVHLTGVYVFLGDGKGTFTAVETGLSEYPSRKVVTADVDGDGDADIIVLSEGPTRGAMRAEGASIRALINEKKGLSWRVVDVSAEGQRAAGDWLTVANLDGNKYLDIVASSLFFGSMDIIQRGTGKLQWESVPSDGHVIPSLAYYFANAAGRFTSAKSEDALVAYVRVWPGDLDPKLVPKPQHEAVTSIDRITITKQGTKRVPITRWGGSYGVAGMGTGDFNGDGRTDLMYVRFEPREMVLLLGDGKGAFRRATISGLPLETNETYDLKVADVNGDRRPDVILMYESAGTTALAARDGSIRVYLNKGSESSAPVAASR